ncbi:hypothetical protein MMB68_07505 [Priestia sp. Y58]|uniref:STAS domain-containing protein n=1 Tax=Priestia TaxID=2800373 RepID=UPI001C8EE26D|nr:MULTISPECIES: STAS domain-containing protein [Priestia]MBX9985905.1 hypothetical protein [Priestia aryabhattai]MBY0000199.1 hypothetical protein [Priestia aryabhattai]MCZ8496358.1 hypothetical protein [Priestia megaterium]MDG0029412.1 hypothetical protein [Priestia sp. Y58]MDG0058805.1 hypothetical protein [Priestia sp. P5]
MSMLEYVPVPYFLVDTEFNILEWSQQSGHLFKPSANFLDLVDVFSQEKARKFLSLRQKDSRELSVDEPHDEQTLVQSRGQAIQKVELVMQTNDSPYSLFECLIQWDGDVGHLVCIRQDERIQELTSLVQDHRKRLADTDFELLEQKERLEKSLQKIKQLSASFIKLSSKVGLIPLFGDLDTALVAENTSILQNFAHEGNYTTLLFDFGGLDILTTEGIQAFAGFMQSFYLMGITCYIIGMKPHHTAALKNRTFGEQIIYMNNLSEIIAVNKNVS